MAIYPIRGIHWAIGWDTSNYVWWARRGQEVGLAGPNTGSRPATVGLLASISSIMRLPVAVVAAAFGPVIAASCGLAVAGFMERALQRNRVRGPLAAGLAAGFPSPLISACLWTPTFFALFLWGGACL